MKKLHTNIMNLKSIFEKFTYWNLKCRGSLNDGNFESLVDPISQAVVVQLGTVPFIQIHPTGHIGLKTAFTKWIFFIFADNLGPTCLLNRDICAYFINFFELMLRALYRMICKHAKSFFLKKVFEYTLCKAIF